MNGRARAISHYLTYLRYMLACYHFHQFEAAGRSIDQDPANRTPRYQPPPQSKYSALKRKMERDIFRIRFRDGLYRTASGTATVDGNARSRLKSNPYSGKPVPRGLWYRHPLVHRKRGYYYTAMNAPGKYDVFPVSW